MSLAARSYLVGDVPCERGVTGSSVRTGHCTCGWWRTQFAGCCEVTSAPRVLHAITTLDRGGAETALLALCRERAARVGPQRIGVAYLKGDGELAPDFESLGIEVRDLDVRGLRAARAVRAFESFRRAFAPDVIHSHLFKADVLASACLGRRRDSREPLVSTKHNADAYLDRVPWRALGRAAAARADALVAISNGVAAHIARTLGALDCPVEVIRYGIEPAAAPVVAPPGDGSVLCVARLEPQKDPRTLLDAFRRVVAVRPARLVLLGRGSLDADVRAWSAGLPAGSVEFGGFVADTTAAYDRADVVVLSSRWEGLGLALVEAGLRARPVVATSVGGIPEVVRHGETGLLVPPGDPAALAGAILRILGDPALARRMGEAAARHTRDEFDVSRCTDAHESLYRRALRGRV